MTFALSTNQIRPGRPRGFMREVLALLALLLALLRPVCDASAASGEWHAPGQPERGAVHLIDAPAGGHFDEGICCASADAQALTVRATAPLPSASSGMLPAPSTAVPLTSIPVALPIKVLSRRDPAPPLPYHARSLRRLN